MRFIVMGAPRSGAGWLSQLLNTHPEIACAGELLAESLEFRQERHTDHFGFDDWVFCLECESTPEKCYHNHPVRYLSHQLWGKKEAEVVGFRATYNQLDVLELWPQIRALGCRVIHVTRNHLASLVSLRQAEAGGRLMRTTRQKPKPVAPVRVSVSEVREYAVSLGTGEQRTRNYSPQILEVSYSSLVSNETVEWSKVCRFLGVREAKPKRVTAKCQRGGILDRLTNWHELQAGIPRHEFKDLEKELV